MGDLHTKTIHELQTLLAERTCSSVDIVNDLLAAIEAGNERIGAYVHVDADRALAQAQASDQARQLAVDRPLMGIPIAVKDVLNVEGDPCRCGSRVLEGYLSPYDATAVSRLRRAGALLVGRTNMDEFAMGSSTENSAFGPTRNPHHLERVAGGSSGGSAAAVGGNLAVAALGSDTGGSIRQPASFCGCVGLKPTYGRISRYGLVAYASSLDQIGSLTKDVRDAAILLNAMAGLDEMDSTSLSAPVPDYQHVLTGDLSGLRLGVPKEYFVDGLDEHVARAVKAAIQRCGSFGADIVEVSLPHTEYAIATYYVIATAEASANLARFDGVRYGRREPADNVIDMYGATRAAGFGKEVKRRIILGTYVLSSGYHDAYYLRAQKVRTLLRRDFGLAFEQCDALLTPVAPTPAYPIGTLVEDPLTMYLGDIFTVTANLAGIPGLSVPCGVSPDGLPIGVQVLGPVLGEETVLRVGSALE
jgi:aspartyl-tRNA(Asn)/glutamyl-tRNA(Gln) amidotransferase subunit A